MLPSQDLIQTFAALGDPTRFAILSKLATDGDLTVQERAGLISRGRDGQRRPCHLEVERLAEAARWVEHTQQAWQARFDRLERFLATEQTQG